MKNMSKKDLIAWAERMGIKCDINAPGDGIRRYNFHAPGPKPYTYGRTLGYCLGAREAELFLRGYGEGWEAARSAERGGEAS